MHQVGFTLECGFGRVALVSMRRPRDTPAFCITLVLMKIIVVSVFSRCWEAKVSVLLFSQALTYCVYPCINPCCCCGLFVQESFGSHAWDVSERVWDADNTSASWNVGGYWQWSILWPISMVSSYWPVCANSLIFILVKYFYRFQCSVFVVRYIGTFVSCFKSKCH